MSEIDPRESTHASVRGFFNAGEATSSVLDLLARQLPDCMVCILHRDSDDDLLRVVERRGPEEFAVQQGQTLDLPATNSVDPLPLLLETSGGTQHGSFVGIPLELRDGERFGTLCAVSKRSERFASDEVDLLTVLGRVIASELQREIAQAQLQQQNADLAARADRLRDDAFTDALTGVANRRGFERALGREWKLSRRGTVESHLVLIDLDGFKAVNDQHGHAAGDRVLQFCARALREAARDTDIVGRLGGDEFAAILVGCDSPDDAAAYRDRAREIFDSLLEGDPARASFSAGSQALGESSSPAQALDLADQAMYWQKRQRAGRLPRGADFAASSRRPGAEPVS